MTISQSIFATQERRQQVASLYLQRKMQSEIAREVGVTQQQISHDLKAIRALWLASSLRDFDAAKSEELQRVDETERCYWQGWQRSQQPREITVTEQTQGDKAILKVAVRREGQAGGDPHFLDGVLKCIERRCAILGLDAPHHYKIDWESLSDEELARLAAGESPARVLARRLTDSASASPQPPMAEA